MSLLQRFLNLLALVALLGLVLLAQEERFAPDEIITKFEDWVSVSEIEDFEIEYQLTRLSATDGNSVYTYRIPLHRYPPEMCEELTADERVDYANPNYLIRLTDPDRINESFPDEIVAKFEDWVSSSDIEDFEVQYQLTRLSVTEGIWVYLYRIPLHRSLRQTYQEVAADERVHYAVPNYSVEPQESAPPIRHWFAAYERLPIIRELGDSPGDRYDRGDYRGAIDLYDQAVGLFRSSDNTWGEAMSLMGLGHCYHYIGDYPRAIDYYDRALVIFDSSRDSPGEASSLGSMGSSHAELGEYGRAIGYYEQALDIFVRSRDKHGEATTLMGIGVCHRRQGDSQRAIEFHEHAIALFRLIGDSQGEARSLLNLARCYRALEDYVEAIALYETCLEIIDSPTSNPEVGWRVLDGLGVSHKKLDNSTGAATAWGEAVETVEQMRGWLGRPDWLATFMREKHGLYHNLVTTLCDLDEREDAHFYAERAKARTLVDMMDMAMALRQSALPPELQEPAELVVALGALEAGAGDPLAVGPVAAVRTGAARATVLTREAFDALYVRIREENEILSTLLAVDPAQIQTYMKGVQDGLGEGTVALEYFVTEDETLVWVITHAGIEHVHRIPITRADLVAKVRAFCEELNRRPEVGRAAARRQRAMELGQEFYMMLLGPVEPYLEEAKHLVVIPSDVLFYVPFAALVRCPGCVGGQLFWEGEYLIERRTVSYGPSLASLYWPLERRQEATSYTSALVVGNPTGDLLHAEAEAIAVASMFATGEILLREAGTKDEVLARLRTTHYDVVHLSTHGVFDREVALGSGVALAHEGLLTALEIVGLRLSAGMAVLSACQTALPPGVEERLVVGDELQGLSQALFVAGVPSAVLTLWDVDDAATKDLMAGEAGMYGHLLRGETRAEGLKRAQVALMGDPTAVYSHPYYWAPFVLYGDWR